MKNLDTYLSLLKGLTSSAESAAVLESVAQCGGKKDLCQLVGDYLLEPIDSLTLDLVRKIDERSRLSAQSHYEDNPVPECLWLLARIVEHVLSTDARPFCAFCYRTVAVRSNGRLKDYCPEHASGSNGNAGGYLRGRAHQEAFENHLAAQVPPDELALKLLRHQCNARRKGGGDAGYIVAGTASWNWSSGSELDIGELKLLQISHGHPDWTELALRWRQDFEDHEGVVEISKGAIAVTPSRLIEQWLRWKAWMVAGDYKARVGKGRPQIINPERAVAVWAQETEKGVKACEIYAQIAAEFGVSEKSVAVFFSRLRKKAEQGS